MTYLPASDNHAPYALLGLHDDGSEAFYSGRAGSAFVEGMPFHYQSLEGAQRQAMNLNRMTMLHGWHFIAVAIRDKEDDEVCDDCGCICRGLFPAA